MAKALPSSQMEIPKPAAEDWSWLATENGFDHQEEPPEVRKKLDTMVLFLNNAFWHNDVVPLLGEHGSFLPVYQRQPISEVPSGGAKNPAPSSSQGNAMPAPPSRAKNSMPKSFPSTTLERKPMPAPSGGAFKAPSSALERKPTPPRPSCAREPRPESFRDPSCCAKYPVPGSPKVPSACAKNPTSGSMKEVAAKNPTPPRSIEKVAHKSCGKAAKPFDAHRFVAERFAKEFEKYDSSSDGSTKEACNLLKAAARLKDCDPAEITEIHMEAALKFFSAACTLQNCSSQVLQINNIVGMYTDAARIFAHCAATSERCANIKVAALAYKCVEVTHFRMLMLRPYPPPLAGDGCEPQNKKRRLDVVAEKTLKSASQLRKLVDAEEHVEAAMDATSKCHRALESAAKDNSSSAEELRSMTDAIEFSFYDVQGFVRLIRLALKNCTA
ncbi:CW-type Zinc Finger [Musa troglodytarum]|uniref:CW-type Zinc Finger n=1 Tax=Musa troglodytarum TaxID=320322 RepID=A0A9E7FNE1_9LILI|nr:CW-type Zinc Finger [Musa troglodytarum]